MTFVFVSLVQTPTAGQRWRSPSSPSPGRDTPSSPWKQPASAVSQGRTKKQTRAPSAELCWCSEAETTRATSTPTWRLSLWRNCSLLFKERASEVNPHCLTGREAVLTPPQTLHYLCSYSLSLFQPSLLSIVFLKGKCAMCSLDISWIQISNCKDSRFVSLSLWIHIDKNNCLKHQIFPIIFVTKEMTFLCT